MGKHSVVFAWMFPFFALAGFWSAEATQTDALPETLMRKIREEPPLVAIRSLEQFLKTHSNVASAYCELAKLYLAQNTSDSRQRAERAIRQAIRLAPNQAAYALVLGDVFWAQGFWSKAEEQYKKVYDMHPENAEAAYKVGTMTFKNSLKYEGMVHAESGIVMDWSHYASSGREQAIAFLEKSIALDSGFRDAYYQLGLVYVEDGSAKNLIRISQQLLKHYPEDKDALLFCGLGCQLSGEYERAHEFYTRALSRMGPEERAVMASVDLIASEEEKRMLGEAEGQAQEDSEAHGQFWRKRNPLFLTPFNERRLEHYSRIAYANLRFSRPSKGVQGWQTDMGKVYIKFGAPVHRSAQRPSMDSGTSTVRPHLERWFYEGHAIIFQNRDGLDGWTFSPTEIYATLLGGADRSETIAIALSANPRPNEVFRTTPARFIDPYLDLKYNAPYQTAAFRERDSIRIEISYALPKSKLSIFRRRLVRTSSPAQEIDPHEVLLLEDGLFVFDERWKEVLSMHEKMRLRLPAQGVPGSPYRRYAMSENGRYLLASNRLYVTPGMYHLIMEARDNTSGAIGTGRELRQFSFDPQALQMSDLLLASRIEPLVPFPEGRDHLEIVPNPIRTFSRANFVFVYFEMYNLQRDEYGRTSYEISYQIGRPDAKEVDPALFVSQDLREGAREIEVQAMTGEEAEAQGGSPAAKGSVAYRVRYLLPERNNVLFSQEAQGLMPVEDGLERRVTVQYEGNRSEDFTYLQIDVGQVPSGIHKLTVTLSDHHKKERMERTMLFRLME